MIPRASPDLLRIIDKGGYSYLHKEPASISIGSFFTKVVIEIKAFFKHGIKGPEKERYVASQIIQEVNKVTPKSRNATASLLARYESSMFDRVITQMGINTAHKKADVFLSAFRKLVAKDSDITTVSTKRLPVYVENTEKTAGIIKKLFQTSH